MITLLLIALIVPLIGVMLFMWHCKEYGNVPDFDVVVGWIVIILFMELAITDEIVRRENESTPQNTEKVINSKY